MNDTQIKTRVKLLIEQSINGLDPENPKIDFKRDWYDLKNKYSICEFLKDTTSIANTNGFDGLIIIGFDSRDNSYHNSQFSNCGLKDSSEIQNIILKNCSDPFTVNTYDIVINNNPISVIHIPQYLQKPILIRRYVKQIKGGIKEEYQRIFVRKNTRTDLATKNDINLMYFERSYLKPSYECEICLVNYKISYTTADLGEIHINRVFLNLTVENLGVRGLTFIDFYIILRTDDFKEYQFTGGNMMFNQKNISGLIYKQVKQQETATLSITSNDKRYPENIQEKNVIEIELVLTLSNNHRFTEIFRL